MTSTAPHRATDAEYWKSEASRVAADRERLVAALARIASDDWLPAGCLAEPGTARAYAEKVLRESPFIPAVKTGPGSVSTPGHLRLDAPVTAGTRYLGAGRDQPALRHRRRGGHPPTSMLEWTQNVPDAASLGDATTKIASFALAFGRIDRTVCRHPDGTPESDTDHTVGLAWFATALAAACEPWLDSGLVTQFALVHDAVEVFAGDTQTLRITTQERAAKSARERDAAARWQAELGDVLPWLPAMIARYEAQTEPEARFIRAADKVAPKFLHMINGCADLVGYGVAAAELDGILAAQREDIGRYAGEFAALLALYDEMATRVLAGLRAAEAAR